VGNNAGPTILAAANGIDKAELTGATPQAQRWFLRMKADRCKTISRG
jgi:hypothetical protein